MIDGKLVEQEAAELKLSVTPEEVDRAIQQVKEQNKLDDATFRQALEQQGFTMEAYRKTLKKQILQLKVVNTAVRSRVTVSDDEVKTYYQAEREAGRGRSPGAPAADPRRRARRSSDADVETKKRVAAKVVELARGGTNFVELAKQFSDDDTTKTSGGDLGWVGKGVLVDALDEAMAAMEPGDVRGPIRTASRLGGAAAGRAQGGRREAVRRDQGAAAQAALRSSRSRRRSSRGCASCAKKRTSTSATEACRRKAGS